MREAKHADKLCQSGYWNVFEFFGVPDQVRDGYMTELQDPFTVAGLCSYSFCSVLI